MVSSSLPSASAAPTPLLAEVTARFGEHLIDIQHIGSEPEPRVPTAGWYILGACTIALGLGLVAVSLPGPEPASAPDLERASLDAPAPARTGGAAGLGALLVLLGVIPLAIAARPKAAPRDRYIIGEGPDVHLTVALPLALPVGTARDGLPLVRALERQIVLGLVPGMTGELRDGPRTILVADLLAQGRSSYALPTGARGELTLGALRFTVEAVDPARFIPTRLPLDRLYYLSNGGALALLGLLLFLGDATPAPQRDLDQTAADRQRAVRYLIDLPPPPPPAIPPPVPRASSLPRAPAPSPPVAPAPAPTLPELAIEVTGPAQTIPKGTRRGLRDDHSYARVSGGLNDPGFNDSIQRGLADAQEGILGYDTPEDRKMWADVLAGPVISRPLGGLELAETERGGGLHPDRPSPAKVPGKNIEIDMYAPRKPVDAAARASARRVVTVELAQPSVVGKMSPQTVREHVRKQADGLKRCYRDTVDSGERVGHVLIRFKVDADGNVSAAKLEWGSTQLGPIGPCLTSAVRRWKFPSPLDRQPASIVIEAVFSARDL